MQDTFDLCRHLFDARRKSVDRSTVDKDIKAAEAPPQPLKHSHHLALDRHIDGFRCVLSAEQCSQECRCGAIFIGDHDSVTVRGKTESNSGAYTVCAARDARLARRCVRPDGRVRF